MQATTVLSVEYQLLDKLSESPIEASAGIGLVNDFQRASGLTHINATNLWQELCRMMRQGLVFEGVRKLYVNSHGGKASGVIRIFDLTDKGRAKFASLHRTDFPD
jgi:hypothetical protein